VFGLQHVAVKSYSCDEHTSIELQQCHTTSINTSAVIFLYDNIDKCSEHCESFHREMKQSYSIIIFVVLVKSTSVSLCAFMDSVKQLADVLPDGVIANGVVVNVGRFLFVRIVVDFVHFCC